MTNIRDGGERPTVLVVDDDRDLAEAYAIRIQDRYDTRVAYSGADALEQLDEYVDIVLLDRRMPVHPGEDVLENIKNRELDTRVIMVTAVDPDLDIVDMPFDDYLQKPIDGDDLVAAIERQLSAREYGNAAHEFVSLDAKIAALQETKSDDLEIVQELKSEARKLESNLDVPLSKLRAR